MGPDQWSLHPAVEVSAQGLPVARGNLSALHSNVDIIQLPPVGLVVVLVLLDIGELAAVR